MVITDSGDGFYGIEWHRTWSDDKYGKYSSGDGLKITELYFSNKGYDEFIAFNNITFHEDDQE